MNQARDKYIEIAKKCTCGFLGGAVFCASMAEISECPIHGNKNCQTQHIEQPYVSLGTISAVATFS